MKHIEQGLRGAWLVFIGQTERGFACFDTSKQGVWRSFTIFFLLVPFYGALLLKEGNNALAGAIVHGFLLLVLVEGIAWLFYPLIMRDVARALQRTHRFMLFVVARNWTRAFRVMLLHTLFLLVPLRGGGAQGEPVMTLSPFMVFLWLLLFIALLRYQWLVAKEALSVHGGQAAMVIFLEMMIDLCGGLLFQSYVYDLLAVDEEDSISGGVSEGVGE